MKELFKVKFNGHTYAGYGDIKSTKTATTEIVEIDEDVFDTISVGKDKWYNRPWYKFQFANALEDAVIKWFGKQASEKIHRAVNDSSDCQEAMDKFISSLNVRESYKRRIREARERHIKDLTDEELIALRKEIALGSLFYRDYDNSVGIDEHEVCDFFDGFLEDAEDNFKYEFGRYPKDAGELYDYCDNDDALLTYANYMIEW